MQKIAITGASGFIARYLISAIKKKYDLVGLVRSEAKGKSLGIPYVVGDITDQEVLDVLLKGASCVIHLATWSGTQEEQLQYHVNVEGTRHVVLAAKRQKVKRILHVSSLAVTRRVKDAYAVTKLQAEEIVQQGGVPFIILRPPLVYGFGGYAFEGLVRLVRKFPLVMPIIGRGKHVVCPLYIKDLINAIEQCISLKKTGMTLNLCGHFLPFRDFVQLVQEASGRKKRIVCIPEWFVTVVLSLTDAIFSGKLPLSNKTIKRMNESIRDDDTLARKLLKWRPQSHRKALTEVFQINELR